MMQILTAQREYNPLWASDAENPSLSFVRRGVLYSELEPEILTRVLDESKIVAVAAGMGPKLFWGRDNAQWVPFDLESWDQNQERPIWKRAWPFCWGDEIWAIVIWQVQVTYLHWAMDGCQLHVDRPHEEMIKLRLEELNDYLGVETGSKCMALDPVQFKKLPPRTASGRELCLIGPP